MNPMIEERKFASVDGVYVEMSDFAARWPDRTPERTWTSCCAFIRDAQSTDIKSRITSRFVDVVPSVKPNGVWLMAGHHWLEMALKELESANLVA